MTTFLVSAVDLQKHTQVKAKKAVNSYKIAVVKAQKDNEVSESQFAVLESEKMTLTTTLKDTKAVRDEANAMANSLKSEQERLV